MASRWLPNIGEYFESLLRLVESSEINFNSTSHDSCEFLLRWLESYERTLSTLLLRITETFGSTNPLSQLCIQQLSFILDRTTRYRVHCERINSLGLEEEGNGPDSSGNEVNSGSLYEVVEGPGRPKFCAAREQIEALKSEGFSWSEIARTFDISERILRRRRHELGINVEGREYCHLSDYDLDNSVRNIVAPPRVLV